MTVHFDDASHFAMSLAHEMANGGNRIILVRDMVGRLTFVIDDRRRPVLSEDLDDWSERLRRGTGNFLAATPIVLADDLMDPASLLDNDKDTVPLAGSDSDSGARFIDRQVVGGDWTRVRRDATQRRVTFYGFKGGVGRSTAAFMLAGHLAERNLCVLVVDLDLESPGVGPLLATEDDQPEFGLVDHLIESVVGPTADLDLVTRASHPATQGNGEVWVAPARGRVRDGYTYLPKLNRLYTDLPVQGKSGTVRFADRLEMAVTACESRVAKLGRPADVVLLDSRAGIHDIAAAAITQLSDLSLLFATDNLQTWQGYAELFGQWRASGTATLIRERLKIVASMTPSQNQSDYLSRFRDHSQACFADHLYDDTVGGDPDGFNFAPDDSEAPHYPLPILFNTDLLGLDQQRSPDWYRSDLVQAAYRQFLNGAFELSAGANDD